MGIAIQIGISDAGRRLIEHWQHAPERIVRVLDEGLTQSLNEIETHLKVTYFGSGKEINNRSGQLLGSIRTGRDGALSGFIGTLSHTSSYARTILGPGKTTIKPKSTKHLWVPVADNLGPQGARMSPREAMALRTPSGKRALRIFESNSGNLIAFLPGEVDRGGNFKPLSGKITRGKKKGQMRGKLLFVLKEEVEIEGTDALRKAADDMRSRVTEIINSKLRQALE